METTISIAKLLWPIMLLIWIGLFINTGFYKKMINDFIENRGLFFLSWILWIIAWILIVSNHNIWTWFPEIIISFIWWGMLIKTTLMISVPKSARYIVKNIKYPNSILKVAWVVYAFLWIYLIYFAY